MHQHIFDPIRIFQNSVKLREFYKFKEISKIQYKKLRETTEKYNQKDWKVYCPFITMNFEVRMSNYILPTEYK